ncbi:MAG: cytochrome c3 family protein, partial [Ignavibacteriales bacterium]|nr:cytochrome c3 family protein [Ignavibacteriales bacterium]
MRGLSFVIFLIVTVSLCNAQSPHGNKFNRDCQDCHTSDSWKVNLAKINFKHEETGFALTGQHKIVTCRACHSSLEFTSSKNKSQCFNCHEDIHENSVGKNCVRCHDTRTWIIEKITDLHRMSRFPLIGNHTKANCNQCHLSSSKLKFDPIGINCFDCHSVNYYATKNPNHVNANFSTDCQQCHSLISPVWLTTSVIHDFFPLTGSHNIANCFACHNQTSYKGLTQDCYSCHKQRYESVSSPNHVTLNFPKDCKQCHTTNGGWKPASFANHDSFYPLTGAHNLIRNNCSQCHSTGYSSPARQCVNCHQQNYNGAPNHLSQGYPTDCSQCHTTTVWQGATFNHSSTNFPLVGAHTSVSCQLCHTNGYAGTPTTCISCHQSKFTTAPNHVAQNYPQDCKQCHSPVDWKQISFDHNTTRFPLVGSHVNVSCSSCHITKLTGTPTTCISCHQTNFNSALNHVAQGYPTDCAKCHTTVAWNAVTFN